MRAISLDTILGNRSASEYCERMMQQSFSMYADAHARLITLSIEEITPLSIYVTWRRIDRALEMLNVLATASIDPYKPIVWEDQTLRRLIFPPVVERWPEGNYLIDGTHRLLAASRFAGKREIVVLQLEAPNFPPLPCLTSSWEAIEVGHAIMPVERVLKQLDVNHFRPVTHFFNSNQFICSRSEKFDTLVDQRHNLYERNF